MTIYQWNGSGANRQEKFRGLELATKIKDSERGGKAKLVLLESKDTGDGAAAHRHSGAASKRATTPVAIAPATASTSAQVSLLILPLSMDRVAEE